MLLDTTELNTSDAEAIDAGEPTTETTETTKSVEATAEAAIGAPSETVSEATSDNTTEADTEAINTELAEVANGLQADPDDATIAEESPQPASQVNEADRRFLAEISVLGQITECNRSIQEIEGKIDHYKIEIKEEKEYLKGEQIRLQRLASKLADIIDGKPLPIDPAKAKETTAAASSGDMATSSGDDSGDMAAGEDDNAWRLVPTSELLSGLPGLGAKKLNSLCAVAPTAGHLEDLRGEASKAHQSFKEVLPKGCGQDLADKIEDRLISCVASNCKSAAEQAAEERAAVYDEPKSEDAPSLKLATADDGEYEDVE
ncbi:hypothetical protein Pla52o_35320 [Novipirellula galeiformis]|uniref:Uncharacterized protein n=1 Tax=Novipirellula galeiformis TaxID=2528004 RepID=A0A5C6CGV6_9BACT|nr:hypothetical protein [Novipirellula galeiformis]TWU22476.1 hypothetical protein Pla52o_35320 [Novipirellula galeiformis]